MFKAMLRDSVKITLNFRLNFLNHFVFHKKRQKFGLISSKNTQLRRKHVYHDESLRESTSGSV